MCVLTCFLEPKLQQRDRKMEEYYWYEKKIIQVGDLLAPFDQFY